MTGSTSSVTFYSGATATVSWDTERVLLRVAGEVDECFTSAGASIVDVVAGAGLPVHVDLSGVTLFTAAGVSWLVTLYSRVPDEVRIVTAADLVRDVLAACRIPTRSPGQARAADRPPVNAG